MQFLLYFLTPFNFQSTETQKNFLAVPDWLPISIESENLGRKLKVHPFCSHLQQCVCTKSLQSCPTLCDPMDCSLTGSSVLGIIQARILEWFAMPSSRKSSQPRDQTQISYLSCITLHYCIINALLHYYTRSFYTTESHLGSSFSSKHSKFFSDCMKILT